MSHGEATGQARDGFRPVTTGGESWVAITVRDALHDAVVQVVAGEGARVVQLPNVVGTLLRYDIAVAGDVDRGIYLATWGRPVAAKLALGHAGAAIVVSPRSVL